MSNFRVLIIFGTSNNKYNDQSGICTDIIQSNVENKTHIRYKIKLKEGIFRAFRRKNIKL